MIELIYAACVWVLLPAVTNGWEYNFYVNGEYNQTVSGRYAPHAHFDGDEFLGMKVEVCVDDYYTDEVYSFTASNNIGESEMSPTLTVQWMWDFDYDGDGVVGMSDFGVFSNDFLTTLPRSDVDGDGIVGWGDFGRFSQRFLECNNGLWVVPCD